MCAHIKADTKKHLMEKIGNHLANRHKDKRKEMAAKAVLRTPGAKKTKKSRLKTGLGMKLCLAPIMQAVEPEKLPKEQWHWQCPICEKVLAKGETRWWDNVARDQHLKEHGKKRGWKMLKRAFKKFEWLRTKGKSKIKAKQAKVFEETAKFGHDVMVVPGLNKNGHARTATDSTMLYTCRKCRLSWPPMAGAFNIREERGRSKVTHGWHKKCKPFVWKKDAKPEQERPVARLWNNIVKAQLAEQMKMEWQMSAEEQSERAKPSNESARYIEVRKRIKEKRTGKKRKANNNF